MLGKSSVYGRAVILDRIRSGQWVCIAFLLPSLCAVVLSFPASPLLSTHYQMWPITCPICLMHLISPTVPSPQQSPGFLFSLSGCTHACSDNIWYWLPLRYLLYLGSVTVSFFRAIHNICLCHHTSVRHYDAVHHHRCTLENKTDAVIRDVKISGRQLDAA